MRQASPLRVAVVGLGIGRTHAKGLLEPPAAAGLCAVCDGDRRRLARVGRELGVSARYTDLDAMLRAEAPDALIVATPNDLHEPMTLAALDAGCHVLCEKPLAHTLASARRIAAAAERSKRLVMLDLSFRFTAAARTVKRYLASGRCGRLYHASTYWARTRGIPSWASWFCDRARSGGGPVIDLGVHRLDLALWFLGDPRPLAVSALTHGELGRRLASGARRASARKRLPRARFDVEEFGGGLVRLEGGRSLVFELSWAENSGRREVMLTRALGVEGGAVHRNVDHTYDFVAELYRDRGGRLHDVDAEPWRQTALVPAKEFVRAARSGARDLPDAARGLELATLLEGIYRSAAEGRELLLAELHAERAPRARTR